MEKVREMGFRFAMLVWNYENEYGCGAAFDQNKGLTDAGKELVKNLLQNLVLDISHLSDKGVEDMLTLTDLRKAVLDHGFGEKLTEKIFYQNAYRFVMENVK